MSEPLALVLRTRDTTGEDAVLVDDRGRTMNCSDIRVNVFGDKTFVTVTATFLCAIDVQTSQPGIQPSDAASAHEHAERMNLEMRYHFAAREARMRDRLKTEQVSPLHTEKSIFRD